mmetsp:Transcript_21661/g.49049  ORF Transcript_21661/g.49049 Transcript_21661/m.49049 type:complete len:352 (-) Transcript_21661:108-1163(-)
MVIAWSLCTPMLSIDIASTSVATPSSLVLCPTLRKYSIASCSLALTPPASELSSTSKSSLPGPMVGGPPNTTVTRPLPPCGEIPSSALPCNDCPYREATTATAASMAGPTQRDRDRTRLPSRTGVFRDLMMAETVLKQACKGAANTAPLLPSTLRSYWEGDRVPGRITAVAHSCLERSYTLTTASKVISPISSFLSSTLRARSSESCRSWRSFCRMAVSTTSMLTLLLMWVEMDPTVGSTYSITASLSSLHDSIASLPLRSSDLLMPPQKLHAHRPVFDSTAMYRFRTAPQDWQRSAALRSQRLLSSGAAKGETMNPKGKPPVVKLDLFGTAPHVFLQCSSYVFPRISLEG